MIIDATKKPVLSTFEKTLVRRSLEQDQVVAFPTDTVYGLGVSGFSKLAMDRLYQMKGREESKPLILFLDSIEKVKLWVKPFDNVIQQYMEDCWPGEVTIVFPSNLPFPLFFSKNHSETIAIRIPNCPLLLDLISSLPFPLVTTSANKTSQKPLSSALEIEHTFNNPGISVPFIVDGGLLSGKPSKIVKFDSGNLITLRE